MSAAHRLWTTEEFLALSDDGVERALIRGELREYGRGLEMTTRGRPHCRAMSRLDHLIRTWLEARPSPRGELYVGDVRIRLRRDPDTIVGADLAYVTPEAEAAAGDETFLDGPPALVIEILSPTDTAGDVAEKIAAYLSAGVAHVWKVDTFDHTVTVYRPEAHPISHHAGQTLSAEPELPGLRVDVVRIFGL